MKSKRVVFLLTSLLFTTLVAGVAVYRVSAATQAEEKAKGEEMLKKARLDLAQAKQMHEASIKLMQAAQLDTLKANQKRTEALALQRQAHLLIRNSNRMKADELREQADVKELRAKSDEAELARLQGLLAHELQAAADTTNAVAQIQAAARVEADATEKAQLTAMADSLGKQGAKSSVEAATLEKRIVPLNLEISLLTAESKSLNDEAARLDPPAK